MGFLFEFNTFGIVFSIIFSITFLMILGVFIFLVIKGISQWNKNNHSPKLTVPVTVVTKRTKVSRHGGTNGHRHTSTSYYVTFQTKSGERMELRVAGREYGMIAEGDAGNLTFQGTRYLGFKRF